VHDNKSSSSVQVGEFLGLLASITFSFIFLADWLRVNIAYCNYFIQCDHTTKVVNKPGSCKHKCVLLVKRLISKHLDEVEKIYFCDKIYRGRWECS
jgi:hypothetical protein